MTQRILGEQGTWLDPEEAAGPDDKMLRKGRVLAPIYTYKVYPDGLRWPLHGEEKLVAVRCRTPDTYFSAPGYIMEAKRRVRGYVYQDSTGAFCFHRYKSAYP